VAAYYDIVDPEAVLRCLDQGMGCMSRRDWEAEMWQLIFSHAILPEAVCELGGSLMSGGGSVLAGFWPAHSR